MPELDALREEARARLGGKRFAHVASVAETAREIAERGGWPGDVREAALRAAWIHDAWKEASPEACVRVVESVGRVPDAWALAHAPHLLHADAAAAWAEAEGETGEGLLDAVRYHPTAHAEWGAVGRILFVADFCEPTREYAAEVGAGELRARAAEGAEGLAEAARRVLGVRLAWMVEKDRVVHPRSWQAWNAWSAEASG